MRKAGLAWMLLAAALSCVVIFWIILGARERSRRSEAGAEVARLANITLRIFRDRPPPVGEAFWREIKRTEPLRDPWGTPYRLDPAGKREFVWRSAGEDRVPFTGDDILARVPNMAEMEFQAPVLAPGEDRGSTVKEGL